MKKMANNTKGPWWDDRESPGTKLSEKDKIFYRQEKALEVLKEFHGGNS